MSDERAAELAKYMAGKEPSVEAARLALAGILIVMAIGALRYLILELPL